MRVDPVLERLRRVPSRHGVVQFHAYSHGPPVRVGRALVVLPDWIGGEVGHPAIIAPYDDSRPREIMWNEGESNQMAKSMDRRKETKKPKKKDK